MDTVDREHRIFYPVLLAESTLHNSSKRRRMHLGWDVQRGRERNRYLQIFRLISWNAIFVISASSILFSAQIPLGMLENRNFKQSYDIHTHLKVL